jgi:hypothetical protein
MKDRLNKCCHPLILFFPISVFSGTSVFVCNPSMCSVYSFLSTRYISSKRAWLDTAEKKFSIKKECIHTHTHDCINKMRNRQDKWDINKWFFLCFF